MLRAGFLGAAPSHRRRSGRQATATVTATIPPASSALVVGQALNETTNWPVFSDPGNYATSAAGATIAGVVVNYIGSTLTASEPLSDGDTNSFSVTVTDTVGTITVFTVIPRTVAHAPPVVITSLADQIFASSTGPQTYDASGAFAGAALVFSISGLSGVSIDAATGVATVDTDTLAVQSGTMITVTATNSGGSASSGFALEILEPIVYSSEITGLTDNPSFGPTAEIGVALTGTLGNLQGGETIAHRWRINGALVAGATQPIFTAAPGQDLQALQYAPTIDGVEIGSPVYTIRHAPPVGGSLPDVASVQGGGTLQIDLTPGFSGNALVYSENVSWASITGSTLAIDDVVRTDTVTVTATNSGGSATVDQNVTITVAPTAPAQMSAPLMVANSASQITATLASDPDDGGAAITQRDLRYRPAGESWITQNDVSSPVILSGLAENTSHDVQTRARNSVGNGLWSPSGTGATLLNPPVAAGGLADLSFEENTGVRNVGVSGDFTGLELTYSVNAITGVSIDSNTGVLSLDTDAMAVQAATGIVVTASNSAGSDTSGFSLTITAAATVPAQMSAPSLVADSDSQITATLAAAPADGGSPITRYDLRYSSDGSTWATAPDVVSPHGISGLTAGTLYFVQARAVNALGNGPWSTSASVTTAGAPVFALENIGEEPVITSDAGALSVTIGSGPYSGTYTQRVTDAAPLTVAMVSANPTPLVLPAVLGTTQVGDTLTIVPGLWLYAGDEPGDQAWQQQLDGADIPDGIDLDYVVQASDDGKVFTVRETFGGLPISSLPLPLVSGDVTAPVLSAPTGIGNGQTGAAGLTVVTDEGNGTLYWGIYPASSTPTAPQVVTGTGATVNGAQSVTAAGPQAITDQTGLAAGTDYRVHFVQDDAQGNRSVLATTAVFTTEAAGLTSPAALAQTVRWFDFTDLATMFTDAARTTNVSVDGDAVQAINDKSGSGAFASRTAGSNTWSATGTRTILSGDGTSEYVDSAPISGASATMEIYVALRSSDTDKTILLGKSGDSNFFAGFAQSGSPSGPTASFGAPTYSANGADLGATRGALHAAWKNGSGVVAGMRNLDVAAVGANPLLYLGYEVNGWEIVGEVTHIVVTTALTTQQRADLVGWLQARVPA